MHGHHVFADTKAAAQAQEELSYRFKLDLGKRLEPDLGPTKHSNLKTVEGKFGYLPP